MNRARAMLNGFLYSSNVVKIESNQQAISINNSAYVGNHIHGLHMNTTDFEISITLKKAANFGNGVSSPLAEDLYIVNGTVKIYNSA